MKRLLHSLSPYYCRNQSVVIAADDSLVSWGPSPTYGELVRIISGCIYKSCTVSLCRISSENNSHELSNFELLYFSQGYGTDTTKSSAVPKEVKPVEGVFIQKVSCGFGHTLLLAKYDTDEEKEKVNALPVFEPQCSNMKIWG